MHYAGQGIDSSSHSVLFCFCSTDAALSDASALRGQAAAASARSCRMGPHAGASRSFLFSPQGTQQHILQGISACSSAYALDCSSILASAPLPLEFLLFVCPLYVFPTVDPMLRLRTDLCKPVASSLRREQRGTHVLY